jgi:hypothetical protein
MAPNWTINSGSVPYARGPGGGAYSSTVTLLGSSGSSSSMSSMKNCILHLVHCVSCGMSRSSRSLSHRRHHGQYHTGSGAGFRGLRLGFAMSLPVLVVVCWFDALVTLVTTNPTGENGAVIAWVHGVFSYKYTICLCAST